MQYESKETEAPLRVVPSTQLSAAAQETEPSTEVLILDRIRTFWGFCLRHKLLLIFGGLLGAVSAVYWLDSKQPKPVDADWTGAEIKSCCRLAALLDVSLVEAAQNVVPVARTAHESVEKLRTWASGRCLAADQPGMYTRNPNAGVIKPG